MKRSTKDKEGLLYSQEKRYLVAANFPTTVPQRVYLGFDQKPVRPRACRRRRRLVRHSCAKRAYTAIGLGSFQQLLRWTETIWRTLAWCSDYSLVYLRGEIIRGWAGRCFHFQHNSVRTLNQCTNPPFAGGHETGSMRRFLHPGLFLRFSLHTCNYAGHLAVRLNGCHFCRDAPFFKLSTAVGLHTRQPAPSGFSYCSV